jgi:uncharacterized protein
MEILKIAVTGGVGSGKTSFIDSVSEIATLDRDNRSSKPDNILPEDLTAGFDFGRIALASEQTIYLYGTRGEMACDARLDVVFDRVDAYVMLIDAHRPQDFIHCRRMFNFLRQRFALPVIAGVTHLDCETSWDIDNIALVMKLQARSQGQPLCPIVPVNPKNSSSVARCLISLLNSTLQLSVTS